MRQFIKQAFSKQIILRAYLPALVVGLILFIIDRTVPEFNLIEIINGFGRFLLSFLKISIPIYALLVLMIAAFVIFKISTKKLGYRQKFILSLIDGREISLIKIFIAYKRMFLNDSRTMTHCFLQMKKLEKRKLIELGCQTGGIYTVQDELFKITKKGQRRLEKISESLKNQAENIFEEIYREDHNLSSMMSRVKNEETIKEIVYVLGILANQLDKKRVKSVLQNDYFGKFRNKEVSDFNYMWSILEKEDFVSQDRGITGYGGGYGELPFYITDKGLEFYNKNKAVIKI